VENGAPSVVTETVSQIITINAAGAVAPANVTVTETVTVAAASAEACPVAVAPVIDTPVVGAPTDGINDVNNQAFEG
jgi:hypothetical protein